MIYSTGSHQQESTTVLVYDRKNSFKFTAPERSLGGQYKLEEGKNNRGFGIISTEISVQYNMPLYGIMDVQVF